MANSTFSGGCFMQGLQTRYGSLSLGAAAATLGQAQTAREVIRYGFQKRLPTSADRPHFPGFWPAAVFTDLLANTMQRLT